MTSPERTVFISYRRADISWALAVYQNLTAHDYDVFFDYKSIHSGDFDQIIVGNIKARAHFLLILTPTTLDRCNEPGDWLRREIEAAIIEKRNIIPLFLEDFDFGAAGVPEKLTGRLKAITKYNGLKVPPGYFEEAMDRLRNRYLDITLDAVLHPIPEEVRQAVMEQQVAADEAITHGKELKEMERKEAEEKQKQKVERPQFETLPSGKVHPKIEQAAQAPAAKRNFSSCCMGLVAIVVLACLILGGTYLYQTWNSEQTPTPTNTTATKDVSVTEPPKITEESGAGITENPTITEEPALVATEPPTEKEGPRIGSTMVSPRDGMVLVYVPAGEFQMGNDGGAREEKPRHWIVLEAFWLDQTEVTNVMYAKCVQDGKCEPPNSMKSVTRENYYGNSEFDNYPVIHVSWLDAKDYCGWVGRRLPTEAEWEKAASWEEDTQTKFTYPWGDSIDCSLANYGGREEGCVGNTSQVGTYPNGSSPYGALDMTGNVFEWVNSVFQPYPYDAGDGREDTSDSGLRTIRGGSWYSSEDYIRTTDRLAGPRSLSNAYTGFRCALSE